MAHNAKHPVTDHVSILHSNKTSRSKSQPKKNVTFKIDHGFIDHHRGTSEYRKTPPRTSHSKNKNTRHREFVYTPRPSRTSHKGKAEQKFLKHEIGIALRRNTDAPQSHRAHGRPMKERSKSACTPRAQKSQNTKKLKQKPHMSRGRKLQAMATNNTGRNKGNDKDELDEKDIDENMDEKILRILKQQALTLAESDSVEAYYYQVNQMKEDIKLLDKLPGVKKKETKYSPSESKIVKANKNNYLAQIKLLKYDPKAIRSIVGIRKQRASFKKENETK
eukprot:25319_1